MAMVMFMLGNSILLLVIDGGSSGGWAAGWRPEIITSWYESR